MNASQEPRALEFRFKLDVLRDEIELVNAQIRQGDEISKSIKEWTITVWAAALGGALITKELREWAWATAVIPLLFWLVDTWHRVVQRHFIWRSLRIMDFLNEPRFSKSFEENRLIDFDLLDLGSRRERTGPFRKFVNWRRVMLFRTLSFLYIGLAILSVIAWIVVVNRG